MTGAVAAPVSLASDVTVISRKASVVVQLKAVMTKFIWLAVLTVQSMESKVQAVTFSSMVHRILLMVPLASVS